MKRKLPRILFLVVAFYAGPAAAENKLFINPQTVEIGQTDVVVPILLDNDQDLYAFSLSLSTDPSLIPIKSMDVTGTTATDAEYWAGQLFDGASRISFGAVLDTSKPLERVIAIGKALKIANLHVEVKATVAGSATVVFQNFLSSDRMHVPDAKNLLVSPEGLSLPVTTAPGDITIVDAGPTFIRGDCNGDGAVIGQVTDAVFLLNYNFLGGDEPPCFAACDVNGDGAWAGQVTDAVYILNYNFLGGAPPPAPFPRCDLSTLESDKTLGCVTSTTNCPP